MIDRQTSLAYAAPRAAASTSLQKQHPQLPAIAPEQLEEIQRRLAEHLKATHRIDEAEIRQMMHKQREAIEQMLAYLDQSCCG